MEMPATRGRPQSAIAEGAMRQVETAVGDGRCVSSSASCQAVKISVGSVDKIIHDHLHEQRLSARGCPGCSQISRGRISDEGFPLSLALAYQFSGRK